MIFFPFRSVPFILARSCQHHSDFSYFYKSVVWCLLNYSELESSSSSANCNVVHDSNVTQKYWRKWGRVAPFDNEKFKFRFGWKWIHHISFGAQCCTQATDDHYISNRRGVHSKRHSAVAVGRIRRSYFSFTFRMNNGTSPFLFARAFYSAVIFSRKFRYRKVCADGIWIEIVMIEWCSDVCVCVRVLCASASCKRNDQTSRMQLSSCTNTVGGGRIKESHHFRTSTLTHRILPVYLSVCDRMCACRNGPQETNM